MASSPSRIFFVSDYAQERMGDEPPGRQILEDLEHDLEERLAHLGVRILESGMTPSAHTFDIAAGRHVFTGTVRFEDQMWVVGVASTLGKLKRLIGVSDASEQAAILSAIEESLRANRRVSQVRLSSDGDTWEPRDGGEPI